MTQPIRHISNFKLRNISYGVERRRNMTKKMLENSIHFPLPVTYEDIDRTVYEWVNKGLEIKNGKIDFPTYKLFSTQRLSEYSQTWNHEDESGNIILNFKTITRDITPGHGEMYGGNYNIPGNRFFTMFRAPVITENGNEALQIYSMKQPTTVNMNYSVTIVTNKYEALNQFSQIMLKEFNSLEKYIFPNDHPMSMLMDSVSDESEYNVDDRKFYAQTYKIKVMAYIISESDFKVETVPNKFKLGFFNISGDKKKNKFVLDRNKDFGNKAETYREYCGKDSISIEEKSPDENLNNVNTVEEKSVVIQESYLKKDECLEKDDEGRYYNKRVTINLYFDDCITDIVFKTEINLSLKTIYMKNIHDFSVSVNGYKVSMDSDIQFKNGDVVAVDVTKEDEFSESSMNFICYDADSVIDRDDICEDEKVKSEEITISGDTFFNVESKD